MTSIMSGFDTVRYALAAQQFALSVTQRNVANAGNPYYTRQEVIFTSDETAWARSGVNGVSLQANRNRYIDYSISQELQALAEHEFTSGALQEIEAVFDGGGEAFQQALSKFFNSFASLSSAPEDLVLRQEVLSSANALCMEFHRVYAGIQQVQTSADQALTHVVAEINSISERIADLNVRVAQAQAARSAEEFTLRDARQELLEELSTFIDISYFETESGSVTVTNRQGGALILEDRSYPLELGASSAGAFQGIFLSGAEITGSVKSGQLGALLEIRDNKTAEYLNSLDELAAAIITRVNDQHALGSDLDGQSGGVFFEPFVPIVPDSYRGAARSMTVALADERKIAAASPGGAAGDNGNARLLAAIRDEKLCSSGSATASEFYAGLIYRVGTDRRMAREGVLIETGMLDHLRNQRDSLTGVNLDEEAIRLIQSQKAYQASARFANVLDQLSSEILDLLGV